MFNFQNLNGLFNLSPETIKEINQAASVAAVPAPAPAPAPVPSFNMPNFNSPGMMQPSTEPSFRPIPAPAPVVTPPTPSGGMLTSASVSGTQGLPVENEETFETVVETPSENQPRTYNVSYSQESGEYQMFNDPSKMEIKQVTEDELREIYNEGGGHRKNTFGSFENFLAYTAEASDMLGNLDWWEAEGVDTRTGAQTIRDEEDVSTGKSQSSPDDLVQSDPLARKSDYRQWVMSDENQALMDKYGIQERFQNDKGDIFEWTGSGYVKTYEAPRADFADYAKAALITATSIALGNAAGAASGLGAIGAGAVQGGTTAFVSGGLSGNLSLQDVATGAVLGGLGGAMSELAKASEATQIETLEAMASRYEGIAGMEETYQKVKEALDAVKAGKDFAESTVGIMDVIQGVQNAVDIVEDWNRPVGEIVWDASTTDDNFEGAANEDDDFVFDPEDVTVVVPNYSTETEEEEEEGGGGGGGDTEATEEEVAQEETVEEAVEEEVVDPTESTIEDTTDVIEQDTTQGAEEDEFIYDPEHDYVYQGNGEFQQVDENGNPIGNPVLMPNYDPVNDDYVVGDMYSGPMSAPEGTVEEPQNQQEEDEPLGDFTFGGGSTVPTKPVETVETVETVEPVETTTDTDTNDGDDGDLTFGGESGSASGKADTGGTGGGTETGEGTGSGEGTGTGTGTGEGDGDGSGEGDGEGDGDGDGSGESDSGGGGGGAGDFTPFMSGISYQLPQIAEIIQSPRVDYNAQLNAMINRNVGLFEGMI